MKKTIPLLSLRNFYIVSAISAIFLYNSCSTDFDITAKWKNVTIVYGMLNAGDTAQYIRVEKAYLDPKTNALVQSHIPDSIYYSNILVQLQEVYSNGNINPVIINCTKVDGNLEGHVKDSSIFAQSPNWLYKTKEPIHQGSTYKLIVTNGDNGKELVSSVTSIVDSFKISIPNKTLNVFFNPYNNVKTAVNWTSAVDGKIYGLDIVIHYVSMLKNDTSIKVYQSQKWSVFSELTTTNTSGGSLMDFKILGLNFYEFMANHLAPSQDSVRKLLYMDYIMSVAGEDFYTYTEVNKASLGLTSGSVKPLFTNIENGLGLLSSRYKKVVSPVHFDVRVNDSLACHPLTHTLNFLTNLGVPCF